jgi:UDP-glucose 4-epimerase
VTGRREFAEGRDFYEGEIGDTALVRRVFEENPDIAAVIHCAALIVVPESVSRPADYYRVNIVQTLDFVETMLDCGVNRLIFSSSASIYLPDEDFSVDESSAIEPVSPYARTKVVVEGMLEDISAATDLRVLSLRYFNPVGTDPDYRTGLQIASPSHALGKLIEARTTGSTFKVTGDQYPTRDGSGIRDYIHVWDLAQAHLAALDRFDEALEGQHHSVINLGTGEGTTVIELVAAFEKVTGEKLPTESAPPRPGDSVGAFTRSQKAERLLHWTAQHSVEEGIADTLTWFDRRGQVLADLA